MKEQRATDLECDEFSDNPFELSLRDRECDTTKKQSIMDSAVQTEKFSITTLSIIPLSLTSPQIQVCTPLPNMIATPTSLSSAETCAEQGEKKETNKVSSSEAVPFFCVLLFVF